MLVIDKNNNSKKQSIRIKTKLKDKIYYCHLKLVMFLIKALIYLWVETLSNKSQQQKNPSKENGGGNRVA